MDKTLFDDLILSLNEAVEYEKGNITLKSTIVEIPDEDINAKFSQLPDDVKRAILIIIDNTLKINKGKEMSYK